MKRASKVNVIQTEEAVTPVTLRNNIHIKVHGLENIIPVYAVADVSIKFELQGVTVGESEKMHVSSNKFVPSTYELAIPCDLTLQSDVDKFISHPITITVIETKKEVQMSKITVITPDAEVTHASKTVSKGSLSDEPKKSRSSLKGDKKHKDKKTKTKEKKETKFKKGKGYFETKHKEEVEQGPQTMGTAMLDLLPIFLGSKEFSQELYIQQTKRFFNENAIAVENLPKLLITVTVEGEPFDVERATILHISVESIFNIPNIMSERYNYQLSILLPLNSEEYDAIEFAHGMYTINGDFIRYQFWPPITVEQSIIRLESTYRINNDLSGIINTNNIPLDETTISKPRIEYNTIKRIFLKEESKERLSKYIRKFRKIPIEIYVTPATVDHTRGSKQLPVKKEKSDEKTRTSTSATTRSTVALDAPTEYLHLMAIAPIDQLFYPGVKSCRVACPIRTYHELEISDQTGIKNSCYRPKFVPASPEPPPPRKEKAAKKEKESKKASKESSSKKSDKGKKGKGKKEEGATQGQNLAHKLPVPPPPPPEPSTQVLNDKGEPSFLLIEFCFMKPLYEERVLEDLTDKLNTIVKASPSLPMSLISSSIAQEMYNDTIRQLIKDMNEQYVTYLDERALCECDQPLDFLLYLQQSGVYQTYIASVTRALSTLIPEKYQCDVEGLSKFSKESQSFIKHLHADMIQQMNKVINETFICNINKIQHKHLIKNDHLLLYAKEACELGEYKLAERYHLERICCDENKATYWFDYAVFRMEIKDVEHSIHSLKEALLHDSSHPYSLFMYGQLLLRKNKPAEAETCLLTMSLMHPRWAEGWGGLYLYYSQVHNIEGMELALQMAKKYLDVPNPIQQDYFSSTEDLAWSSQFCTDIYSRTAVLMIKLRLLDEAERMIKLIGMGGIREYLLAVLAYYDKEFLHALEHLDKAKDLLGTNYGICGLIGHCFMKINNQSNAIVSYEMVLPMFNRPDDIHLIYLFCGMCYDVTGSWQKARKLALLCCKYSPTPQTWTHAGSYYFKQNDLLSAEQCLIQANLCDNRLPEPWTYLALINANLGKEQETQLCLTQAKRFGNADSPVIQNVEKILDSMKLEQ